MVATRAGRQREQALVSDPRDETIESGRLRELLAWILGFVDGLY